MGSSISGVWHNVCCGLSKNPIHWLLFWFFSLLVFYKKKIANSTESVAMVTGSAMVRKEQLREVGAGEEGLSSTAAARRASAEEQAAPVLPPPGAAPPVPVCLRGLGQWLFCSSLSL